MARKMAFLFGTLLFAASALLARGDDGSALSRSARPQPVTVAASSGDSVLANSGPRANARQEAPYHFRLTRGAGTAVCDVYLERLNSTRFEKPPFCDRPESDAVKGFAILHRVPLSPTDVRDLYPIVSAFMRLANQKTLDWTDMNFQTRLTRSGQSRLTESESKYLAEALQRGWAKIWRYDPPIDIDNDGVPDNVEIWHGTALPRA